MITKINFGIIICCVSAFAVPTPVVIRSASQNVTAHSSYSAKVYSINSSSQIDLGLIFDNANVPPTEGQYINLANQSNFDQPLVVYLYVPDDVNITYYAENVKAEDYYYTSRIKHIKLVGWDPLKSNGMGRKPVVKVKGLAFGGGSSGTTKDLWSFENIEFIADAQTQCQILNYSEEIASEPFGLNCQQVTSSSIYAGEIMINRCRFEGFQYVIKANITKNTNLGTRVQNSVFINNEYIYDYERLSVKESNDQSVNRFYYNTTVGSTFNFYYSDENGTSDPSTNIRFDIRSNLLYTNQNNIYVTLKRGNCNSLGLNILLSINYCNAEPLQVVNSILENSEGGFVVNNCADPTLPETPTTNMVLSNRERFLFTVATLPIEMSGTTISGTEIKYDRKELWPDDPSYADLDKSFIFINEEAGVLKSSEDYSLKRTSSAKGLGELWIDDGTYSGTNLVPADDYYGRTRINHDLGAIEYFATNPPDNIFWVNNAVGYFADGTKEFNQADGRKDDPFVDIHEVFSYIKNIKDDADNSGESIHNRYQVNVLGTSKSYSHFTDAIVTSSLSEVIKVKVSGNGQDMPSVNVYDDENNGKANYSGTYTATYFTKLTSGKVDVDNLRFDFDGQTDPSTILSQYPSSDQLYPLYVYNVDNSGTGEEPLNITNCYFSVRGDLFEFEQSNGFHSTKDIGGLLIKNSKNIILNDCYFSMPLADFCVDIAGTQTTGSDYPANGNVTTPNPHIVIRNSSFWARKYECRIKGTEALIDHNSFYGLSTPTSWQGCGLLIDGASTGLFTKLDITYNAFIRCNRALQRKGTADVTSIIRYNRFLTNNVEFDGLKDNDAFLYHNKVPGADCNSGNCVLTNCPLINMADYHVSSGTPVAHSTDEPFSFSDEKDVVYGTKTGTLYRDCQGNVIAAAPINSYGYSGSYSRWLQQREEDAEGSSQIGGRKEELDNIPYENAKPQRCNCPNDAPLPKDNGLLQQENSGLVNKAQNLQAPYFQPTYRRDYIFQAGNLINNYNFESIEMAAFGVTTPVWWTNSNTAGLINAKSDTVIALRDKYSVALTGTGYIKQKVILDPVYNGKYILAFGVIGDVNIRLHYLKDNTTKTVTLYSTESDGHDVGKWHNYLKEISLSQIEEERSFELEIINTSASGSWIDFVVLSKQLYDGRIQVATTYYDGLQRSILSQVEDGAAGAEDVIVYTKRDVFGRDSIKTLPVRKDFGNDARHKFILNPLEKAVEYYKDPTSSEVPFAGKPDETPVVPANVHPFVVTNYYDDPRGVTNKTGGPGYTYTTEHPVEYNKVGVNDLTSVGQSFLPSQGSSPAYLLEQTKDEEGKYANVWKDKKGNIVKTETKTVTVTDPAGGSVAMTSTNEYYPATNLLKKSVSPKQYEDKYYYDSRKNLTIKETPDASPVEYRYDDNNNLRFIQDGNSRMENSLVANKYDGHNRLIGVYKYNLSGTSYSFDDVPVDDPDFPSNSDANATLLTENLYDRYSENNLIAITSLDANDVLGVSYEKLENIIGRMHTSVQYFNDPYAPNARPRVRHLFSYTDEGQVAVVYEFIDGVRPRKTEFKYNANGSLNSSTFYDDKGRNHIVTYTYDTRGLLESYSSSLGADVKKLLNYIYNANGQTNNILYSKNDIVASYKYHIKGMVTDIAYQQYNPTTTMPLFRQKLGYDKESEEITLPTGITFSPRYDGNVSWQISNVYPITPAADKRSGYVYKYDEANRLVTANYFEGSSSSELTEDLSTASGTAADRSEDYVYDQNGNIVKLSRKVPDGVGGTSKNISDASYQYAAGTNLLQRILNFLFPDKTQSYNYVYDNNGNMVMDKSKKMVVLYDHRNMPVNYLFFAGSVSLKAGMTGDALSHYQFPATITNRVFMVYDATGNRVAKLNFSNENASLFSELSL